ncbi:Nitrogen permease regulator 3 [Conoideocrella luteorostrata]|uniref:Nitrogen permease regulator 3 n=1 Tax=Conoideocrella luteorostrata TaxID=1105319 RepID=A0AAJ0FUQ3_9HYPO|nr:Nitrogen permease regulator 3 [Conoideocrella luteorostrata]
MSSITSENFLAVALVINRSRDGPAFVFHYPPDVRPVTIHPDQPAESTGVDEDILLERLSQPAGRDITANDGASKRHHHDDHPMTEAGSHVVPWEHVAGFPTRDLASILTPARAYHKKLFQLSLDPMHCISYPIHVPENGKWKRNKKSNKTKLSKPSDEMQLAPHETEPPTPSVVISAEPAKEKDGKKDDADEEKRSSMTMFNLVFILNPKKSEDKELVDALYHNVVKKVNKAYKYSQQHCEYVWKESKRILLAKDRAREEKKSMSVLWKELLQTFSLAASVHDIYEAVSRNKIATLHLDTPAGILTPSVQIPAPFFVSDIPSENDDSQHGLWLTTANSFLSQEQLDDPEFLDKNFALLLLEDEKKVIAELQTDRDPTTVSMIEFARLAKPTMSFYQVGQSNVLTASQVRKYAQHFIFWRRAIAVPPLHARDVYIISPNCDLSRLPQDSIEWQRAFPLAPPLPNFLSELSHAPRPFKTFCPSKPHRPLYLRMLAWLLRGGWVTQLCTFAYVVVWPEILYEVEYEIEAEELAAAAEETRGKQAAGPSPPDTPTTSTTRQAVSRPDGGVASSSAAAAAGAGTSFQQAAERQQPILEPPTPGTGDEPSPKTRLPHPPPPSSPPPQLQQPPPPPPPTTTTTTTTASTAEQVAEMARLERIALKASREAANKATAHVRKIVPVPTTHPSINDAPHLASLTPHIIVDARKATGKESRYLSAIAHRLKDDKVRAAWQPMCKYFDGRNALERIALQEEMKRKEAWTLLLAMSEHLLCTRHW